MKTSRKIFFIYTFFGMLYLLGSIFQLEALSRISTFVLIPVLILYYRFKSPKWFLPMVVALLCFYIRDILLLYGFSENRSLILIFFGIGVVILYIFALTSFQKSKVHVVELISLFIMYSFLGFLFYTVGELVPQVMPSFKGLTYLYLLLLTVLLAITFTQYLLKSHYASLWLMLTAASLLISELSLFFKLYIISDISVNVFFPLFHVIAYFAMVEHALHRRRLNRLPYF